ncbi:MAG: hypothetical protein M1819_003258 [Sarea resinae]|nr:MAG: hypothetical protein M1819_003258 [Sarea resinae]
MTIMYASEAVARILGISAEEMTEKSFYYCIQENCLPEAIRCLESAKANDSIAYLRFWFRDPRQDEHRDDESLDDANSRLGSSSEEEDGGVELERQDERPTNYQQSAIRPTVEGYRDSETSQGDSSTARTSGNSTDIEGSATNSVFDGLETSRSSTSSLPQLNSPTSQDRSRQDQTPEQVPERNESIELEAVVSCTSDGMVVILRRARPVAPEVLQDSAQPVYANGLFASPWAQEPILPLAQQGMAVARDGRMVPRLVPAAPYPQAGGYAAFPPGHAGPPMDQFMNSIREVAVFAWALTGINGCLETYGRGKPMGESQPPDGFPVWAPDVHEGNVTGAGQASSNRQFPPPPS